MFVITLGDPFSITVEAIAAMSGELCHASYPTVIVGSESHWRDQLERLGMAPDLSYRRIATFADAASGTINFLDTAPGCLRESAATLSPRQRGKFSLDALAALRDLPQKLPLAVLSGPIDKQACHEAGYPFPGQTEFFEDLWQRRAIMLLAGPKLRVGLVTNHAALKDVPSLINAPLITLKLKLLAAALREVFHLPKPRIAVCGLNPHASDGGLFGHEESEIIAPAIAAFRAEDKTAEVSGPLPADTVFFRAYHGAFDAVLAMYHDQGLGPLKTVHFDNAVNISGALPHLRVSPDHGPASDLFLKRRASHASFGAAIRLCHQYLKR